MDLMSITPSYIRFSSPRRPLQVSQLKSNSAKAVIEGGWLFQVKPSSSDQRLDAAVPGLTEARVSSQKISRHLRVINLLYIQFDPSCLPIWILAVVQILIPDTEPKILY